MEDLDIFLCKFERQLRLSEIFFLHCFIKLWGDFLARNVRKWIWNTLRISTISHFFLNWSIFPHPPLHGLNFQRKNRKSKWKDNWISTASLWSHHQKRTFIKKNEWVVTELVHHHIYVSTLQLSVSHLGQSSKKWNNPKNYVTHFNITSQLVAKTFSDQPFSQLKS